MLTICTWHWGNKYSPEYLAKLKAGLVRNLDQPFRFVVATPQAEDVHLTEIQGCFCRLRMFDQKWQFAYGIRRGERVVCIDLDVVVTGKLDALFDRDESFVILKGANAVNPNPFNGSLWMLRAGYRPDIWWDFSIEAAQKFPFHEFADDQAWFHAMMPDAAVWDCGPGSGVWSFQKRGWPKDDRLPPDARLVAFPGRRDPSQFTHLDWVKQNWQ